MIKTLRITGVAAVAFAGLVLVSVLGPVSWIHLGSKNDPQMDSVLSSLGAVERFQQLHGDKNAPSQDTKPPLVKQAELFKDIIDPKIVAPERTVDAAPVASRPSSGPKIPVQPSAQFTLIGTSCSASDPNSSFAYVRESGKNEVKWYQCGDTLGYLTIKEVRENSILCWDGQRDREVPIEAVPDRVSLLETDEASISPSAGTPVPQPVQVKVSESPAVAPRTTARPVLPPTMRGGASKMTDDERAAVSELLDKVKKMNSPGGDANAATAADRRALAEKLVSELRSSRVSPQETRKLENMGDQVTQDNERAKEEQKRELMKRLNPSRPSQD
jgi:hypothetical protein